MQASREFQSRAQAAQRAYLEQSQGAREAVTALISQRSWREGQLLCWQHRPDVDALSAHLAWMGRTAVRRRLMMFPWMSLQPGRQADLRVAGCCQCWRCGLWLGALSHNTWLLVLLLAKLTRSQECGH